MKIVITGGLGFIFSHVTEHFLQKGYDVHVIDNLSAGSHEELIPELQKMGKFTFHEQDVSFLPAADLITRLNPEYIVHAAAISDVDYSIKQPTKTLQANNNATMNVFDAARKCKNLKKLLYVSTDEVYGECEHPKTESEILFPRNPYALSKAFGSILRLAYDNTYPELRDKTVETRFCNVFGPRQDARKIIPAIKRALDTGEPVALHNAGAGYREWIYVKDIPRVIELLLESGHRTYNITAQTGYTVMDLIFLAEKITRKTVPTIPGKRSGMDKRYSMSGERISKDLGWRSFYPFAEAFTAYITGNPL